MKESEIQGSEAETPFVTSSCICMLFSPAINTGQDRAKGGHGEKTIKSKAGTYLAYIHTYGSVHK
jgi:hypothetical protein